MVATVSVLLLPNIIVYTDEQIRDIKAFCFDRSQGSVLSFVRTFNFGSIYVTASVYKNVVLRSNRTGEAPIFLGPLFIHGHSDTDSYGVFFGHLATRFADTDQSQLTLGSDEELALRKCMNIFSHEQLALCVPDISAKMLRAN